MKALLILSDNIGTTKKPVAGNPRIEVLDSKGLWQSMHDWLFDYGVPPHHVKYVYFDNVLYEIVTKSVLADVMTGIEI